MQNTHCTHRVEKDSEEELSSANAFVQFPRASGVLIIKDSVCEKTARLPGQHLHRGTEQKLPPLSKNLLYRLSICDSNGRTESHTKKAQRYY